MTTYIQCDVPGCSHREGHDGTGQRAPDFQPSRTVTVIFGVSPAIRWDVCKEHFDGLEAHLRKAIADFGAPK